MELGKIYHSCSMKVVSWVYKGVPWDTKHHLFLWTRYNRWWNEKVSQAISLLATSSLAIISCIPCYKYSARLLLSISPHSFLFLFGLQTFYKACHYILSEATMALTLTFSRLLSLFFFLPILSSSQSTFTCSRATYYGSPDCLGTPSNRTLTNS